MEDTARKITKALYGDNYDHSQYERILTFLHGIEKSCEIFREIITNLIEFYESKRE